MKIGSMVKAYRNVNRLSLRALSKILGLSLATVHRIEHNKPVDQATVLLLMKFLFGGEKESPNTSTNKPSDAIAAFEKWIPLYEAAYPERNDFALTIRERECWRFGYNYAATAHIG